jgi:hypothetical protein
MNPKCASKNVHDLGKKVKASFIDDAHFSMAFMASELTQQVFELELLNVIYYFTAPIILETFVWL